MVKNCARLIVIDVVKMVNWVLLHHLYINPNSVPVLKSQIWKFIFPKGFPATSPFSFSRPALCKYLNLR